MTKDKATAELKRAPLTTAQVESMRFDVDESTFRDSSPAALFRQHTQDLLDDRDLLIDERDQLLAEVAELRAEALKGICVYCGYIEQYESLEQKASEEGNAMRVAHIRQCEARPELKLIAFSEQLIDEVARLREALEQIKQSGHIMSPCATHFARNNDDDEPFDCDCPVSIARATLSSEKKEQIDAE